MDSYLQGADIHEFLACLGRNAIANVTYGFSDLQTLEPDIHNPVFVEDEEPSLAGLASIITEGGKEGWNENQEAAVHGAPFDNGWGAAEDDGPCDHGWGMADTQENGVTPPDGGGWNTSKEDTPAASGWGMVQNAPDNGTSKVHKPSSTDWDTSDDPPLEGGWGDQQTAATGNDDGWDSMVKSGGHKIAPAHPHRETANTTDPTDNYHASERRSGMFGPSGSNLVPIGKRRVARKGVNDPTDDSSFGQFKSGGPSMKTTMQCVEEGDQTARENCEQVEHKGLGDEPVSGNEWGAMQGEAPSDNGWSVMKTSTCDDAWGMDDVAEHGTQENAVASQDGKRNAPKDNTSMSGWGMGQNTLQNRTAEEVTHHDSGWGMAEDPPPLETGWVVAANQQKVTTASDDGWDAMESQNVRDRGHKAACTHPSRKAIDTNNPTESHHASERRSGMFGPSGSNTVPVGKRKYAIKTDVSRSSPDSYSMKKTKQCGEKGDQAAWATCEQTASVDDPGWGSSTLEEGNIHEESGHKGPGQDEWVSQSEHGMLAACCWTNQIPKDDNLGGDDWKSAPEPDPNGWGSETLMADNSQGGGWDDLKSDAPSIPHSVDILEQSQAGWGYEALDPSDIGPPTRPPRQDDMPRPRRRAAQGSNGDSWAGVASNIPTESQSRRPRLRALMASPEYAELDELHKSANKILHYNGYQNGDKLNPEDQKFVLEKVLAHHPDKEAKLGCGADYLMIDTHSDHQVSCFFVVRKDGSKTDFSYWKCLEGMLETKYSQVAKDEVAKEEDAKDSWERGN